MIPNRGPRCIELMLVTSTTATKPAVAAHPCQLAGVSPHPICLSWNQGSSVSLLMHK